HRLQETLVVTDRPQNPAGPRSQPGPRASQLAPPASPALPQSTPPATFTPPPTEPVPDSFSFAKPRDPHWYQRAVFYEVLVRGFHASNSDGTGDLRGLTSRLDYLHWLGIDCIWLLPIYASPVRDGGYDISDFTSILPDFGTIGDFVELVD